MRATIKTWGNSLALRLPRHVAEQFHLEDGSTVDLEVHKDGLTITPLRKKFSLAELLSNEPARAERSVEVDWGRPKGDEVW
jgi:antitoxin MazE